MELERRVSSTLAAQTERDRHIAQLIDELAQKSALLSALLEQAGTSANAVKAAKRVGLELRKQADPVLVQTSRVKQKDAELVGLQAKLDELLLSRTQDARALDQAQSALQKAKADADEHETEQAEVRAELQARKSELEASLFTTACASALVRAGSNRSPESHILRRRSRRAEPTCMRAD